MHQAKLIWTAMRILLLSMIIAGILLPVIGCTESRWKDYPWLKGPMATEHGLQAEILDFSQQRDNIHVHLEVRNLTDRDVTLHQSGDHGETSIARLICGSRTSLGKVFAVRLSPYTDSSSSTITQQDPINGDLTIQGHSAEELEIDFPFHPALPSIHEGWTVTTGGKSSSGEVIEVHIDIPPVNATGKTTSL